MSLYLEHFGLREAPFRITPATDVFFTGAHRGHILTALRYAIEAGEGLIKVTGEVGSGKTMLSRMLTEQLPETTDTIYIATPSLSRDEVLHTLAEELGLAGEDARPGRLLRSLQNALIARYREGRRVVAVIDEAHAMPEESLEQIRLLSNLESGRDKLLQIVLFGQPELDDLLSAHTLRPLRERITHSLSLPPLDRDAVAEYIEFRLRAAGYRGPNPFTPGALAVIARTSAGLTRRVNILADKALLAAFAANRHSVEKADAERAARDCDLGKALPQPGRMGRLAAPAALAGTVALAVAAGWLARDLAARPPEQAVAPAGGEALARIPAAETAPPAARPTRISLPEPPPAAPTPPAGNGYVIQLAFAVSPSEAGFAALHAQAGALLGADQVRTVPTRIGNRPVVALCAGHYKTRDQALAALKDLPEPLQRLQPQIRSLAGLEADLKKSSQNGENETKIKN